VGLSLLVRRSTNGGRLWLPEADLEEALEVFRLKTPMISTGDVEVFKVDS